MGIASRIARSPVDVFGGWEDQIKTKIALDAAAATTAAESQTAKDALLHTTMLERMKGNFSALEKSIEAVQGNPTEASQAVWKESLLNLQRSEQELLAYHGIDSKAVANLDQLVFRTVDEIAKEAKEQGIPFSQKGSWSDTWIEFFQKKFPNLDPAVAEALWRGRITMMKYAEAVTPTGDTLTEAGDELISRDSPAGRVTEFYGGGADIGAEILKEGGEFLEGLWKWDWSESTPFEPDRTSRDFWQEKAGVKPLSLERRLNLDSGLVNQDAGGLLTLGKDLTSDALPPTQSTGTFLGADNTAQLQAIDEEATSVLTDAAEAWLIKYQEYAQQYGKERAMQLLSREWLNLKLRDRRSIQKFYAQRNQ